MTNEEQMFGICDQYKRSGLSLKSYCEQNAVNSRTLRYWLGKMDKVVSTRGNFVKLNSESVFECRSIRQILEIEYPNGVKVRASIGFEVVRKLIGLV